MKVLLVGGGGREHALAWKLRQSPLLSELLVAPGNPGTATLGRNVAVRADDVSGLVALAVQEQVDLVVVGPEVALAGGIADRLAELNIACFGPARAAAQLEWSKTFAKTVMERSRHPDRPLPGVRVGGRCPHVPERPSLAGLARRESGRPPCGQGRRRRHHGSQSYTPRSTRWMMANRWYWKNRCRDQKFRCWLSPTAAPPWRCCQRRIISAWAMATRDRIPAAWARMLLCRTWAIPPNWRDW